MKTWYRHRFHTVASLRLLFFSIRLIPRFAQPAIASVTALIFFLLLGSERRAVKRNLQHTSARRGLRMLAAVYRVFYSFCDLMVSYSYVPGASDAELLKMLSDPDRGQKTIDACLARGKGLVVWTAHLGNPEFASRLLELHGRKVHVARIVEEKPAEQMLRDRMTSERLHIVNLRDGAQATIELLQALRRNEIVAIQGDRTYQPKHSARLPFFGAEADFPTGPFLLARAAGAPLLPGVVVRQSWLRYKVLMGDPIEPDPSGNLRQSVEPELHRTLNFLEQRLTHYDVQWINFYDFWQVDSVDRSR